MILPVVALPSLDEEGCVGQSLVDTLTSRLGALSEVVLRGSGDGGGVDAAKVKGYVPLLRQCPCRVGPFEVLSGDRDAKVSYHSVLCSAVHEATMRCTHPHTQTQAHIHTDT